MGILRQIRRQTIDPKSTYLLKYAQNVSSQFGEDGIIAHILNTIKVKNAWCVEFGAWDGKTLSNTYNLIARHGWNGVLIEGNEKRFKELQQTYGENNRAHLLFKTVGFDDQRNSIQFLLKNTPIPYDFDLMSIDIDGNDWYVWNSITKYHPRVVVIEFNNTVPNDIVFIQNQDFSINHGCSLLALIELGKEKGYELACATHCNGIFVVKEDFDKLGIEDNSIDKMYMPYRDGRIFQGFDGTLINIGLPQLLWIPNTPIDPFALQILTEHQRKYPDHLPPEIIAETKGEQSEQS